MWQDQARKVVGRNWDSPAPHRPPLTTPSWSRHRKASERPWAGLRGENAFPDPPTLPAHPQRLLPDLLAMLRAFPRNRSLNKMPCGLVSLLIPQ